MPDNRFPIVKDFERHLRAATISDDGDTRRKNRERALRCYSSMTASARRQSASAIAQYPEIWATIHEEIA
jgi:hypothetical protein